MIRVREGRPEPSLILEPSANAVSRRPVNRPNPPLSLLLHRDGCRAELVRKLIEQENDDFPRLFRGTTRPTRFQIGWNCPSTHGDGTGSRGGSEDTEHGQALAVTTAVGMINGRNLIKRSRERLEAILGIHETIFKGNKNEKTIIAY